MSTGIRGGTGLRCCRRGKRQEVRNEEVVGSLVSYEIDNTDNDTDYIDKVVKIIDNNKCDLKSDLKSDLKVDQKSDLITDHKSDANLYK